MGEQLSGCLHCVCTPVVDQVAQASKIHYNNGGIALASGRARFFSSFHGRGLWQVPSLCAKRAACLRSDAFLLHTTLSSSYVVIIQYKLMKIA